MYLVVMRPSTFLVSYILTVFLVILVLISIVTEKESIDG